MREHIPASASYPEDTSVLFGLYSGATQAPRRSAK